MTAKNNSLMGVIGTTWHTLSQLEWLIPHISDKMWGNNGNGSVTHSEYELCCAYNVRRCVPAKGIYEDAGIAEYEI